MDARRNTESWSLLTGGRRAAWPSPPESSHVSRLLMELNIRLPYNPAVVLLGIYPRGMEKCSHKSWYTNVHYSSAHAAKPQKPPSCPSSIGFIHMAEFSSAKRDEPAA